MDVSVIIVNYNTKDLAQKAVDSVFQKTIGVDFEVIVVDNNSPDKPINLKNDKRIIYIQSKSNLGFGQANNLGARFAKGQYLFFLNPDTLLCNNSIQILKETLENNPKAGACGGNLYDRKMSPMHSYSIVPPGILCEVLMFTKNLFGLLHDNEFNSSDEIKKVAYVTGADLMISKNLFEKIGGFNPDFFMYFEETYLCYQVQLKGLQIVCNPFSKIIHLESQSFVYKKYKDELYYSSRKQYLLKRYGKMYFVICNLIHLITCLSRVPIFLFQKHSLEMWLYRIKLLFC